jgi:glutamyl-tRNA synthetase
MQENVNKPVRVRMAPSPTGQIHIGNVRTVLFNWLFARKNCGTFILRIEDTDKERSRKEYEEIIFEDLAWLGIAWDEGPDKGGPYGPYRQSERTEIYKKYLKELLEKGEAYYCYCTKEDIEAQKQAMASQGLPPKYSGHCRNFKEPPAGKKPEVIRFKVPEIKVGFDDMIRGKVVFDAALFGDMIIAKDLENPLYNFAVVVDDALMEITHVIRGEEHLSNTPKQILMQKVLGLPTPKYAHLPLILNPDRSKMSKRFADTALRSYRAQGYLPEAIMNFLAFLGWHPKGDADVLPQNELVEQFDLSRVQKAGAVFNQEKLDWMNREYLKKMSDAEIAEAALPFFEEEKIGADIEKIGKAVSVIRGRASTLRDFVTMGKLFFQLPEYEAGILVWQKMPSSLPQIARILNEAGNAVCKISTENFARENLTAAVMGTMGERRRGEILWPLRVALSGQAASPDPIEIMEVIGKEESLKRIGIAVSKCEEQGK